jgi:alpha-tubulin suppressor-like RCC1 family protein
MNITSLTCDKCGGALTHLQNEKFRCDYCGNFCFATNCTSEEVALLQQADLNRQAYMQFEKALDGYEAVLRLNPNNVNALWGMLLAEYGIEYVKDIDGTYKPTFHRLSQESVIDNTYFKKAVLLARGEEKVKYFAEAGVIEENRMQTLIQAGKNESYDIFICYKKTTQNGGLTPEAAWAQDYYNEFTAMGYKVFFADKSIKAGSLYEPTIYNALTTAKFMIILCSDEKHLEAPWVINEWGRFLRRKKQEPNINFCVVYSGIEPYNLPRALREAQALNHQKATCFENLKDAVAKTMSQPSQIGLTEETYTTKPFSKVKKPRSKKFKIKLIAIITIIALVFGFGGWGIAELVNWSQTRPINARFVKVSAGSDHTIAIDVNGNLWSWGESNLLGRGAGVNRLPDKVMQGTTFKEISAGLRHNLAIDAEGNLWAWGQNDIWQLGDGTGTTRLTPVRIAQGITFKEISAGDSHSLAIDTDGILWSWGSNNMGQLGGGEGSSPVPQRRLEDTLFKAISAGVWQSYAIDVEGNLWAFGGSTGTVTGTFENSVPAIVENGTKFKQVSSGKHTLAIDENGGLWAWGQNEYGQLANGTLTFGGAAERVLVDTKFKEVSAGGDHSLAITEDGKLMSWGLNNYGQLGVHELIIGNTATVNIENPVAISINRWQSMALDADGFLWAWGFNNLGQLGVASYSNKVSEPFKINR